MNKQISSSPPASAACLEAITDTRAPLSLSFIRIPYDIERAIREAADEGMPDLAPNVDELRTARYRGRR